MTPVGRFRIVADRIVQGIRDGDLQPGDQLPSIRRLMVEHGETKPVVTAAIRWLSDRGWVRTEHGVGSFVASDNPTVEPPPTKDERIAALEGHVAELRADVADLKAWRDQRGGER